MTNPPLDEIQLASQRQFASRSSNYGAGHILADVRDVESALAHTRLPAIARVLDVATGGGHTGLHLASLGHSVTLADLTAQMLERASEAAAARGLQVEVRQHPAEKLPYTDGSFDLVTCRVAPHHFTDVAAFVKESARVLQPGGWFLLIDGSVPDDEPEAEEWIHQIEKLRDPSHHRLVAPRRWQELCAGSGLQVVHCELTPMEQPSLRWYFDTAGTSEENRRAVLELIETAPKSAHRVFKLQAAGEATTWWWPRLTLVARKA